MNRKIFLNGKILALDKAKVSILEPGFLYGFGLFETMRSRKGRIIYLDQHIQRIQKSSQLIGIKFIYREDRLKEIIKQVVKLNGFQDSYVKLVLWKAQAGTTVFVTAKEYKPYPEKRYTSGSRACISDFRQNETFLAQIKTTNRILYQLSLEQAKEKGFDEAIILNQHGYITEGTRCNIFFVKNTEVFTPALACGCLDGITRKAIFNLANGKIIEGNFTIRDLLQADEAFLTNSLMGVMLLVSMEGKVIGKGRRGRITKWFIEKYSCLLK